MKSQADFEVAADNKTLKCKHCTWSTQVDPRSVKRKSGSQELAALPFQAFPHRAVNCT